MGGITTTQSIRYGYDTDPVGDWTMVRNMADDMATQLDLADAQAALVLQSPAAIAHRGAPLAIAVSTLVSVPFDNEQQDTHGMIDIPGQPQRLTASALAGAGVYIVQFIARGDTTGWTRGDIIVNKNAAFHARKTWRAPQYFGNMQLSLQIHLGTVGDYVTFQMYHEGGGTTNISEATAYIYKVSNN